MSSLHCLSAEFCTAKLTDDYHDRDAVQHRLGVVLTDALRLGTTLSTDSMQPCKVQLKPRKSGQVLPAPVCDSMHFIKLLVVVQYL